MLELMPLAQEDVARGTGAIMLIFLIFVALATIFWIWMIVDCLTSNMPASEKVLWFLVILFLHLLGAVLYFVIRRPANRPIAT